MAPEATRSIPIVFGIGGVALGLVTSLNRPGANVTGVTQLDVESYAKRLHLLQELIPTNTSVGYLSNPTNKRNSEDEKREAQKAGSLLGLKIVPLNASSPSDIEAAFAAVSRDRIGALVVGSHSFFVAQRNQIATLATNNAVPTVYSRRELTLAGCLVSYGASLSDGYRQVGVYAAKVLKRARPSDLPVLQSAKFELVIDLTAAKALGLAVPSTLLARADELIE